MFGGPGGAGRGLAIRAGSAAAWAEAGKADQARAKARSRVKRGTGDPSFPVFRDDSGISRSTI
jgi:hypothetical protein